MRAFAWSVFVAVFVSSIPLAQADHGSRGMGLATLTNGSEMRIILEYEHGYNDRQVWSFQFVSGLGITKCKGSGSVEVGFVSSPMCPVAWKIAGTGEYHAFPNIAVDHHVVQFTYGGVAGSLEEFIYPP